MKREVVNTKNAPAAIGPYSQAVSSGGWVFVSGQIPLAPDGTLYLCHRFAGDARFAVGSAFAGVDRSAVARLLKTLRRDTVECSACWARFLCGGPCLHDLCAGAGEGRPDPMRCELLKRVYELAMWMYASLSPDARRALGAACDASPPWSAGAV